MRLLSRGRREMKQCRLRCGGAGHGGEELLTIGLRACNCHGWAASIETIVMLLELKMTLLVHDDDGWGAGTISDGYAHGEWLGSLVIWQLWCCSEGWEKRGCFLELLERKEMMKASICFFLFCVWRLPLVKIVAIFIFILSFTRVYEIILGLFFLLIKKHY